PTGRSGPNATTARRFCKLAGRIRSGKTGCGRKTALADFIRRAARPTVISPNANPKYTREPSPRAGLCHGCLNGPCRSDLCGFIPPNAAHVIGSIGKIHPDETSPSRTLARNGLRGLRWCRGLARMDLPDAPND